MISVVGFALDKKASRSAMVDVDSCPNWVAWRIGALGKTNLENISPNMLLMDEVITYLC